MRILLIGGTGHIGTWLTRELSMDHEVIVTDTVPFSSRQTEWLMSERATWEYFPSYYQYAPHLHDFDAVVPLVGQLGSVASMEDPLGSLWGAKFVLWLLAEIVEIGAKPLIVFPSSDLVHRPRCLYSIHKALIESYLERYHFCYDIPYVSLRTATCYGPWQRRDSVINLYIRLGLQGQDLPVYGEPYGGKGGVRAFIYTEDAARAFRLAIEGNLRPGEWYNLAGHNNTITEVANAVSDLVGGTVRHVPWPEMAKLVDVGHLPIESHILHDIGWRPKVGLGDGILRTARWISDERHY